MTDIISYSAGAGLFFSTLILLLLKLDEKDDHTSEKQNVAT